MKNLVLLVIFIAVFIYQLCNINTFVDIFFIILGISAFLLFIMPPILNWYDALKEKLNLNKMGE